MIGGIGGRPAVVLLAEDDPGDQELTRRAFEEGNLNSDLHIVENGEEALDYLKHRGRFADPETSPRPDLILLDLNMPKVDGRQALRLIKSDPELRRISVVILTTSQEEEDVIRSYDLGCNSYISKPMDIDDFISVIRSLETYWFQLVNLPPR
ncbi:response regulator [Candidatus Sumerlaeota bacterium]|nr:response regulator [Candidatus Sumerlaeota bacterium]